MFLFFYFSFICKMRLGGERIVEVEREEEVALIMIDEFSI